MECVSILFVSTPVFWVVVGHVVGRSGTLRNFKVNESMTSVANMESFAALFEESLARQEMRSGEVITAEIVRVDHNFVVVNAGLKSEAFIPVEEF